MKQDWFKKGLLKWNETQNKRQMPWKGEKDPYKIWLSEIILQQTRVEQGLEYYKNFIKAFPTIKHLAKAPDEKVFKLWEGLGYYTRCKNLLATARYIADERKGKFPDQYDDILHLKGVGAYTAAAIASFAYNLPYAVVDGNVFRIISRVFGIKTAIDSTEGKKQFSALADELLDRSQPGLYNQAIMDFGATVCKPKQPNCVSCPFNKKCVALKENKINEWPVKSKTLTRKERWFYYFIIEKDNKVLVRKRTGKDIWENLHDFFLVETKESTDLKKLLAGKELHAITGKIDTASVLLSETFRQQLTHQDIYARFIRLSSSKALKDNGEFFVITLKDLRKLAFPKIIVQYLEQKNVNLNLF